MAKTKREALLDKAKRAGKKAEHSIDNTISKMNTNVKRAVLEMNRQATLKVRSMLTGNLIKSGIKSRTGKLRSALNSAVVKVIIGGKNPRVVITLPDGISAYNKRDGGGDAYKAFAAINYGAVRGSKKSASKKKILKDKAEKNSNSLDLKTKAGSIEFGSSTSVTKAANFWELTTAQQSEIRALIMKIFNQIVFSKGE